MAISRTTNTQAEALKGLVSEIADIKSMPDADLPFLIGIETQILQYMRQPMEQLMGQMPGQGGGAPPGQPMPPGGQMAPPPGMGMGQGPTGPISGVGAGMPPSGRPGIAAPNPDEVRRMLNQGGNITGGQ